VPATRAAGPARLLGDQRTAVPSPESTSAIQPSASTSPLEQRAPVTPAAGPQPAGQTAPLHQQLAQPMIRLATAPNGDHTVVVRVAPDELGPVTVQAHVSDAGVRIELFAPNEAAREAIKQILPELRRDLTSSASDGSVNVSDHSAPSADSDDRAQQQSRSTAQDGGGRAAPDLPNVPAPTALSGPSAYALDVFA
ncbi:MAG: flagellar hook-length control protein FliK, partial [Microbacteriaceae bacterium]|nr:flagellar hook-length control protein FliK [Microbacteriaceae bacterium]